MPTEDHRINTEHLLENLASRVERVRLEHLAELVRQGALDRDIFQAVVKGKVYFLADAATSELADQFAVRYKCDLEVFSQRSAFEEAIRNRLPEAVVLGATEQWEGVVTVLPELLVAALGAEPPAVVLITNDAQLASAFEVVTYPAAEVISPEDGPEGLLEALARHIEVERTGAELRTDEAVKERIGLDKARAIQDRLLPQDVPKLPWLDLAAFYAPCQEVGGDYYDFIPQPDGGLGVVCADVSGKGVGAAMVMVMFRSLLRLAASRGLQPEEVLRVTNKLVTRDMLRGMFVTALYLTVKPGRLVMANAGHLPPIVVRRGSQRARLARANGLAVGLVEGAQFAKAVRPRAIRVGSADMVCLYTDGVVEARNADGQEFGTRRLARALCSGAATAQEAVDAVVAALDAFTEGAPQHDDTTLVVLRLTGQS